MLRATNLKIDTATLQQNLALLRLWNGAANFFCPMVKANAYGHGLELVARAVATTKGGASALGVALVEEGLELRRLGIDLPILVFAPLDNASADAVFEFKLTPVAGRFEDLIALGKHALKVHLKFNTGMNRLGFTAGEIPSLQQMLQQSPGLEVTGVCTHLSHGDEIDQPEGYSQTQLKRLHQWTKDFPGVRHAHKSSSLATLARSKIAKTDEVGARPGIGLYGLAHDADKTGPGLRPILSWRTHLVRTHAVEKDEAVSYSARWVAPRRSRIGVVPVGYGDGYRRALSNKGEMLYRGQRVPVVGSVCMDYTLIDLTDVCRDEPAQVGEEVVLIGQQGLHEVSALELAEKAGTIVYEVVTGITQRVAREAL